MRYDPEVLRAVKSLLPREPSPPLTGNILKREVTWRLIQQGKTRVLHIRRVQEAVAELRRQGVPVVSGPDGYRISRDPGQVEACYQRERKKALRALEAMAHLRGIPVGEVARQLELY